VAEGTADRGRVFFADRGALLFAVKVFARLHFVETLDLAEVLVRDTDLTSSTSPVIFPRRPASSAPRVFPWHPNASSPADEHGGWSGFDTSPIEPFDRRRSPTTL